jgi:hypothetical protein
MQFLHPRTWPHVHARSLSSREESGQGLQLLQPCHSIRTAATAAAAATTCVAGADDLSPVLDARELLRSVAVALLAPPRVAAVLPPVAVGLESPPRVAAVLPAVAVGLLAPPRVAAVLPAAGGGEASNFGEGVVEGAGGDAGAAGAVALTVALTVVGNPVAGGERGFGGSVCFPTAPRHATPRSYAPMDQEPHSGTPQKLESGHAEPCTHRSPSRRATA